MYEDMNDDIVFVNSDSGNVTFFRYEMGVLSVDHDKSGLRLGVID